MVAAGSGDRFGSLKQYEPLGDRRVVDWSLTQARAVCDGVVLVVPAERRDAEEPHADVVAVGGATRSASVRAGLALVPADVDVIVVHDAARPLASSRLWREVIGNVKEGHDAVVPVVPVTDTLREVDGRTVDRARFVAVQTPQAFRAAALRRAHEGEPDGTDDASLVEAVGGKVLAVHGDPENRKITTPADLVAMRAVAQ